MIKNEQLERLPENVQAKVLEVLKAYTGCYVMKNRNGEYSVNISIGLTAHDTGERCVASFKNDEIYTDEEIDKYAAEVWGGTDMSAW